MPKSKPGATAAPAAPGRQRKPVVAIVGRPNVGKSTLFNRLVGARQAIVEDIAGTTRDRLYGDAEWKEQAFTVVDTGGLEPKAEEGYSALIREQVEMALAEADAVLFVVDAVSGLTPVDAEIGEMLRRGERPVLLVANKADNEARQTAALEFYEMGLGDPMPVSAYHGLGVREVQDRLIQILPTAAAGTAVKQLRLAIVGRPNVGKSSIVNAILGQDRVIVSDVPGTTRDVVDTPFVYKDHEMVLVDTAGIRRPGKVERGVEKYSVMRAREAIQRCDVAVLVVDASEKLAAQDMHIAGYVAEAYKGLVIAVNKWDLAEDTDDNRMVFAKRILGRLKFTPWAPLAFLSAKTGLNVEGLLDLALEVEESRSTRIPTSEVNVVLREAVAAHPPPSPSKRPIRIKFATQAEVNPPTFIFFTNDASLLHFSYRRYLENALRRRFGFEGTAIKLVFRS
ncbi:MAG TPA: ribosome biogenesis GTPase Der, partial [Dehalococcoidia bacterium]|nr:ribosome biogenesis GTPase Der [Dehalococcoidia bacterium]